MKMATKQVLVDTRQMSWGTETRLYRTAAELRDQLPARLAERTAVVLKQKRGMGGNGVWKVQAEEASDGGSVVLVQHGLPDSVVERLSLDEFVSRCAPYFAGDSFMVEQPYQSRLAEGMIRVYMTHDRVVGFTHQYPRGLLPPTDAPPIRSPKVFEPPDAPAYGDLRTRVESVWVPEMQQLLGIDTVALPVIWDADFLYGGKTALGADTYVLCEINASSTFAFPEHAMPTVAEMALQRIGERASRS
jgi:hypothetical protein